jgi:transposase
VDSLVKKVFGASSEKLDPNQPDLFIVPPEPLPGKTEASCEIAPIAALEKEEAKTHPGANRNKAARKPRWPEDLPVVVEVLDPVEVTAAPESWRCIGEEISEQLDYEPAQFLRRRLVRRKFVLRAKVDAVPIIAKLPERLLERSLPAAGLLAQIIVGRFVDHLPFYRQEQIFWTRHRVWLPRQSQSRWMELAADWLRPIYDEIRRGIFHQNAVDEGYVQIDETPIRYMDPGGDGPGSKSGFFWTASRPGGDAVYTWQTSRAATSLDNVVPADFSGIIQCDGYAAYASFAKGKGGIQLAGCWAHARRKFFEARELDPIPITWVLRQIGKLYHIEAQLRQKKCGPALREVVRAQQSRPIYDRLHRLFTRWKWRHKYLPKSGPGQALTYALNLWPQLGVYLTDGRIEIDQNLVENAIRPTAIGKKNWLFIGSAEAGQRSAILYTVVECCRRRGLDPHAYLRDILTRLPHCTNWQIKNLTPQAWAQAQSLQAQVAA